MNIAEEATSYDYNSPLWVVTSYYNPANYKRRLQNFKAFRQCLNAPLLVVELSGSDNFQLDDSDAEIVLQLAGEDRLWQKERLINIGAKALPAHVKYVAWVDCDVIFLDPHWPQRAIEKLACDAVILQLFNRAYHVDKYFVESDVVQSGLFDEDQLSECSTLVESSIVPFLHVKDFSSDTLHGRVSASCLDPKLQTPPPSFGYGMGRYARVI